MFGCIIRGTYQSHFVDSRSRAEGRVIGYEYEYDVYIYAAAAAICVLWLGNGIGDR